MSIVSTSNRWLNRLYKTVAILLVLLAVLISAFRLLLPYVHHYKEPVENYLNEELQANLSIGSLNMTWQGSGPALIIGDVQALDTENAAVFIKQLELKIDFWRSLTTQSFTYKSLVISGADVDLSDKLWLVDDSNSQDIPDDKKDEVDNIHVISDIFLNRIKRFSIRDSQITVRNKNITRNISLNQLQWLNTGPRHQAQGSVVLNGLSSNNLQVKLDLKGRHANELTGQAYLQANHIDITPWLDQVLALDDDKTKTDITFSAWLRVNESEINRLQLNFSDSHIEWLFEETTQQLTLEKGQLLLVKGKEEDNLNLYSTPLALTFNNSPSQEFTAMLATQASDFSLYLSEIDMRILTQLTPLLVAKEETRNLLTGMQLNGKVTDLYVRKKGNVLQTLADFSNVNSQYSHGIPGFENIAGTLSYNDNSLAINFAAENGQLDFDKLFLQAFPYEKFSGNINAHFNDTGWVLGIDALDFISKDINLWAELNVNIPTEGEANLALLANVSNGNAGLVGRYLPLPIMSEGLVNYLNNAIVSGRVEDAQVLINGPMDRFPFSDGSGIFVVDAELSEAEFRFAENWPTITNFLANLNFTNNSMLITGRGGELTGLDVTGIKAAIADYFHEPTLTVDADIKTTKASNIAKLMNQSPQKDSVGSVLDHLNVSGNVSGDFHLSLPFDNADSTVARGNILFNDNEMALQVPRMDFSEVEGQLSFNNDKITTKNLQLVWQGLPIAVEVNSRNKADYYDTDIKLNALWKANEWLSHIPESLKGYVAGELPWQGLLSLHQHHQDGFSYNASFDSTLVNTQLLLPAPYTTNETQESLLSVKVNGQSNSSTITLNYNDKLQFSGLLDHEKTAFTHANLMLGGDVMALPSEGFHITTTLKHVDFSDWQPLISDILTAIDQPKSEPDAIPLLAAPKRIRGAVEQLDLLGQEFTNVSFNLFDKTDWWLLQLNANETRSQIKIFPDWLKQGLDINSEFLTLKDSDKENADSADTSIIAVSQPETTKQPERAENDIIFANIPPLTFHCDRCSIGLLDLGKVDVNIKRLNENTIEFTQLQASRGKSKLSLTGRWLHDDEISNTSLQGNISIHDVESELKALTFDSIIKDSGGEINLNLNWAGGLHNFDIAQVNGDINARLDDGYLADVSDKARIFSVLSLQSLVRKLTLDFRDIFSDGMFYSNIKGNYHLEQGMLITKNTEMTGTAGDLFMRGHTNLLTGDLDYKMTYKPNLTSSLPVIAWIATLNPVTFLAGVAIDQVIRSQVVSEFNFSLTGNVEAPDFKEINRKSKDISIDNPEVIAVAKEKKNNANKASSTSKSTDKLAPQTAAPITDKNNTIVPETADIVPELTTINEEKINPESSNVLLSNEQEKSASQADNIELDDTPIEVIEQVTSENEEPAKEVDND